MPGSFEIWVLVAIITIVFGIPRLQRVLEQRVDEAKLGRETLAALAQRGVRVRGLASSRATLEDVFLQLTGRALRD